MVEDPLQMARIGAYSLNHLVQEFGIRQLAERFAADAEENWLVVDTWEVRAVLGNKSVAEIHLEYLNGAEEDPVSANIIIQDIFKIIRPGHLRDFEPAEYGIEANKPKDWKGDRLPDLDVNINLEGFRTNIAGFDAPRRPLPRNVYRRVNVKRAIK